MYIENPRVLGVIFSSLRVQKAKYALLIHGTGVNLYIPVRQKRP